ncbi:winged helix-turn-helix domain-containing protein [Paraferrimonas sedimenticola]|uniref:OmpR/PhoB-type domain-containing protein n=1 Tax=Paraferrimonas sedimenticola TaxID=375674 RepID=A0AA37RUJ6_9GAMM|nr:winged helix-turn-helix domain-containing protein [Paraferrimonas sedimenticola]GLP95421.1 hypothetical protein GCM10007895_07270 [Paraferrimonas sedimenticola]
MGDQSIIFNVGEWLVDSERSLIQRDEETVHLEPKVMAVLVFLAQHANRVVSREQLLDAVWQRKYASDDGLTRAISVLRKQLHDDGKQHHFIKTIPKKGYMLELAENPFALEQPSAPLTTQHRRWWPFVLGAGVASAALLSGALWWQSIEAQPATGDKPIALIVESFNGMDNGDQSQTIANVLGEQVLTQLSQLRGMRVPVLIANSNSRDQVDPDQQFAINGSVTLNNDTIQINVRFVKQDSGAVIWSQGFESDESQWPQLVNTVSRTIARFIQVSSESQKDMASLSVQEVQVLALLNQARSTRRAVDSDPVLSLISAAELLQQARVTYPDRGEILSELAISYFRLASYESSYQLPNLGEIYQQAKVEDGESASFQFLQALHYRRLGQYELALESFNVALAMRGSDPEIRVILGNMLRSQGRFEEALSQYQNATDSNISYPLANFQQARLRSQLGQNGDAVRQLEYLVSMLPHYDIGRQLLTRLYFWKGRFDQSISLIQKADEFEPWRYLMADSQFALNLPEMAVETYSADLSYESAEANYYRRAITLLIQGRYHDAVGVAEMYASLNNSFDAQYMLGRVQMLSGDFSGASRSLQHALQIAPQQQPYQLGRRLDALADLAWSEYQLGNDALAQTHANKVLERIEGFNRVGVSGFGVVDVIAHTVNGDLDKAHAAFSEALAEGWLSWHDVNYGGPHPALLQLEASPRYPQWMAYIQESLSQQRKRLQLQGLVQN